MQSIYGIGRYLFILPFAIIGLLHFMDAQAMAETVVPKMLPAKEIFVYLTGIALIAASISIATGKKDRLAATLLAVFLLLVVVAIHVPHAVGPQRSPMAITLMMKDIALAGAALLYASHLAKDRS